MNKNKPSYQVIDFPPDRRDMPGINALNAQKHFMYGLIEVDVTLSKRYIEDYRAQTGELLSFTSYLACCLARAVDENKAVQAYMQGRKQLMVSDDVDVGLMVERKLGEQHILTGYVIRGANRKSYLEIHREIRQAQSTPVPPNGGRPAWFRSALLLPWPLSAWLGALIRLVINRNPAIFTSMAGTVGISSVGMFGKGISGWGLAPVIHVLDLIVGSIAWKPAVVEDRIEPRQILNITAVFDHDTIDGAPAARFMQRLVELIESGYGLDEEYAGRDPALTAALAGMRLQ